MSRALLILDTPQQRQKAAHWVANMKHGTRVEFKEPKRTDDQNAKMWAMLTEVAQQVKWHGLKLAPDDWKLIFMAGLKRELRLVPNLDGDGLVSLSQSSSDLSKSEMSDLIELMFEFGANPDHPVQFRESSAEIPPADEGSAVAAHDGTPDPSAQAAEPEAGGQEAEDVPAAAPASGVDEREMVNGGKPMETEFLKAEMVKKILDMAGDQSLSPQERLENLDTVRPAWDDQIKGRPGLVAQCFATAAKVIRGELPRAKAQQYLETL